MSLSVTGSIDEELVDILIFACSIANRLGLDLADAIRAKEAHNETRTWPHTTPRGAAN
jgi:NTP pyrophosphatase (non-canonical NTP hydrolase)